MRYQLDNGLTVILERQTAAPVVALQVWVKAGSADEAGDQEGLAHLHEHMLFKGTARRGLGEIARDVEARGGEINAWTSFDQTVYHLVLSSRFLGEGLDILSDAVRFSAFDSGELSREVEVVIEEIKRSRDLPSRKVARAMFETAFLRHPYRRPVLGTEESVRSFNRERVLAFFTRHYTPDNMVVVVVGDFDEARAREQIARHFGGPWGQRADGAPVRAAEQPQQAMRLAVAEDGVKEAHFAFAFHVPEVSHEDIPALDLLAVVLGQGEGSRLNLALKLEQALTSDVYAYAYTPKEPGLMVCGAALGPENLRAAVLAMATELRRLCVHPLDEAELTVAKAIIEADAVYGRETVQGVARKLGFYECTAGGLEFEARYYAKVAKVTAAEVQQAARRYLDPKNLTLAGLFPSGAGMSEEALRALVEQVWREGPPPRPAQPVRSPDPAVRPPPSRTKRAERSGIVRAQLPGGATVLVKPERGVPLVALRAVFPGGLRHETEATNGISQMYGRLMTRSTALRSSAALAREIDELAGTLSANAGRNSITLRGEFLTKHFERSLELFAECINAPAFDGEELERERAMLLQELAARDDHPSGAAFDLFARTLYTRHPYRLDVLGEEPSVKALATADLQALRQRALRARDLTLAVVGDVDVDLALAHCERLFAGAPDGPAVEQQVEQEPSPSAPRRAFRELDKAQAHVVYGFLGTTVRSPQRHVLDVLSSVLSGQGGRLFVELRDRRSLAYSVSSFSVEGIDPGYFGVYLGTSPDKVKEGLAAIRIELARLTDEPIPEAEIDRARRYLIGAHAIGLQKNSARAAMIAYDDAYGVGADAYLHYDEQIEAVTPRMVQDTAQALLEPKAGALAILGPKSADLDFV